MIDDDDDRGGRLGPMLGLRRPSYETLEACGLGDWASAAPADADVTVFVNLGHALRQLFSEYGAAALSRGELERGPRLLAAELCDLAGHYRNYLWTRRGRRSTLLLYHSTAACPERVAALPGYKATYYAKRVGPPPPALAHLRRWADRNLEALAHVLARVPNAHCVDTGDLDPEAWPWALMAEGRVPGAALVVSGWDSDLQYACAPAPAGCAVLRARGPNTLLLEGPSALARLVPEGPSRDAALLLPPSHLRYAAALAGDEGLGVPGLRKTGLPSAARLLARALARGRLPAASPPSLAALLEDSGLPEGSAPEVAASWACLDHASYCAEHATPSRMAACDRRMADLSGLGDLEAANRRLFPGRPIRLPMLLAGEEGY